MGIYIGQITNELDNGLDRLVFNPNFTDISSWLSAKGGSNSQKGPTWGIFGNYATVRDNFLIYYSGAWPNNKGGDDDETETFNTTPTFGFNFSIESNENGTNTNAGKILIVRKSDRKCVLLEYDAFNGNNSGFISSLTITQNFQNSANYPELQRLRLLGYI